MRAAYTQTSVCAPLRDDCCLTTTPLRRCYSLRAMATRVGRQALFSERRWRVALVMATVAADVVAVRVGYRFANLYVVTQPIPATALALAPWPVVFALFGLYSPRRLMRVSLGEFLRGVAAAVVATLLALLALVIGFGDVWHVDLWGAVLPALLVCCLLTVGLGRIVSRLLTFAANDWRA